MTNLPAPMTLAEYREQMITIPAQKSLFKIREKGFKIGRTPITVGMWQEYAKSTNNKMPDLPNPRSLNGYKYEINDMAKMIVKDGFDVAMKQPLFKSVTVDNSKSYDSVWKNGWDAIRNHPIVNITWDDCKSYADWAELFMPTVRQWEFAARGGLRNKIYPWGNDEPSTQLWWEPMSQWVGTAPVDRTFCVCINSYGIVDIVGNVWQWCDDYESLDAERSRISFDIEFFKGSLTHDRNSNERIKYRSIRGGCWYTDNYQKHFLRVNNQVITFYHSCSPIQKMESIGVRLCSPL
jgi:formylglycine-generating enzyme required for sulfatase activity